MIWNIILLLLLKGAYESMRLTIFYRQSMKEKIIYFLDRKHINENKKKN
jgi:hypothetical protein